jgi:hypothetical protein
MDVSTAQEKSEQVFFAQPKAHKNKSANLNKMVPTNLLKMIAFFKQCQATDKAAGILKKIAKDKQPKERKTAQLFVARSRKSSHHQHCSCKYSTIIKATDATVMINDPTIIIKTIGATIALNAMTRHEEQQVLQQEGLLQVQSLQEKERQGHAQ